MALFLTLIVNSFAVLKFTSASSKALLTSFNVSATLISVIFPCPLRTFKAELSLSVKLLNIRFLLNYILSGTFIPSNSIEDLIIKPTL